MPPRRTPPSSSSPSEQELELLRFVGGQNHPVTVGETVEGYANGRGLARSTIVTMLERLRKKGCLRREPGPNGVLRYAPQNAPGQVDEHLVRRFVERTLAGSLAPLAAYFAGQQKLTPSEVEQLTRLLEKLEDAPGESGKDAAE